MFFKCQSCLILSVSFQEKILIFLVGRNAGDDVMTPKGDSSSRTWLGWDLGEGDHPATCHSNVTVSIGMIHSQAAWHWLQGSLELPHDSPSKWVNHRKTPPNLPSCLSLLLLAGSCTQQLNQAQCPQRSGMKLDPLSECDIFLDHLKWYSATRGAAQRWM